jgi:aspartate carbamoyltransferase/aspartate carbamoyltransferase regulatory subunit
MFDVISMRDFSKEQILAILDAASEVKKAMHDPTYNENSFREKHGRKLQDILEGKTLFNGFLENSTRTFYSFRKAALAAGAEIDGFSNIDDTSLKKGETYRDTFTMLGGYGIDMIAMRSKVEGLPRWISEVLAKEHKSSEDIHSSLGEDYLYNIPIILNGGDGKNQHPTQCFLDLFTMREILQNKYDLDLDSGFDLALLNDLAHGRTNRSIMSVAHLFNFNLHLAYPERFGPPGWMLDEFKEKGVDFTLYELRQKKDMLSVLENSLIAYHSRPQKERVGQGEDLITIKELGQITRDMYDLLGEKAPYLMHPLPVDAVTFEEIAHDLDDHPKNISKSLQAQNGIYIRIALMALGTDRMNANTELSNHINNLTDMEIKELHLRTEDKTYDGHMSTGRIQYDGLIIDHIPPGIGRRLEGVLGFEKLEEHYVPSFNTPVLNGRNPLKDILKLHFPYELSSEQLKALALLAPDATINMVKNGKISRKFRPVIGNYIKDRIICGNDNCVTNLETENVIPYHIIEGQGKVRCNYCEQPDTIQKIFDQKRFIYI